MIIIRIYNLDKHIKTHNSNCLLYLIKQIKKNK